MITRDDIEQLRQLQVVGTTVATADATVTQILAGNGARLKVRVTLEPSAAVPGFSAPALLFRGAAGFVRFVTFTSSGLSVEICATHYGSVVTGPLFCQGIAATAITWHVVSVALNQPPSA